MGTKTASIRLDKELFDKIDEHCVTKNCSRNDFVKNAIESALGKKEEKKPYYDKYGNYCTFNKEKNLWTIHLDAKNVKITDN